MRPLQWLLVALFSSLAMGAFYLAAAPALSLRQWAEPAVARAHQGAGARRQPVAAPAKSERAGVEAKRSAEPAATTTAGSTLMRDAGLPAGADAEPTSVVAGPKAGGRGGRSRAERDTPSTTPTRREAEDITPAATGRLTFRASEVSDVYVDGQRVGRTPLVEHELVAGSHRIRFDCHREGKPPLRGSVRLVEVVADETLNVENDCPEIEESDPSGTGSETGEGLSE